MGRAAERGALGRLLADVRGGGSPVLVLRGAAGVGKSALLDHLAAEATESTESAESAEPAGCRVAAAAGVRTEMELPFAAVHQLCVPMLDLLDGLPGPQQDALGTAFGMRAGPVPDLPLLGAAVLGLLARAAEQRPLVCLVDDAQWLDPASARLLAEAADGLAVAGAALVFAVREPAGTDVLPGLPVLEVGGLPDADARTLVGRAVPGPLDEQVRDRILAEARGNPRALLELPRAVSAGGFPTAATGAAAPDRLRRRLGDLPPGARTVLLLAAAEPVGDPDLLRRAAALLGAGAAAVEAAGGLVEVGGPVRFRDPFDRSAVYDAAGPPERRRAHRALAEVTADADLDRRAWHRAHGAAHPDEGIAADLERSAGRARERGGLAAAAAFLERAAALTPEAGRQAERVLAAAETAHLAGALASARALLAVGTGLLDTFQQARADVLRGRLAFAENRGGDAPSLLVRAAERLEPFDAGLARAAYLDAVFAGMFAGRLARPGGGMADMARAAGAAPRPPHPPRASDLLLDGFAVLGKEGTAAAVPVLRQAVAAFGDGMPADEELRWMWPACVAAWHVWDDGRLVELSGRFLELARGAGALGELPLALTMRAQVLLLTGDLAAAEALTGEVPGAMAAAGGRLAPYAALALAALRGREAETSALAEAAAAEAAERGEGLGVAAAELAAAVLGNGLGRYGDALAAAERAAGHERDPGVGNWAAVELVEAAARTGGGEAAAGALRRVTETAAAGGTDWALGVAARSRALLADDADAEPLHRESIDRLGRTRVRSDLARAHLLYGERLRRERRRAEAREHLRTALDLFTEIGMAAFARRAARELRATGETARERTAGAAAALTPREAEIAALARAGLTNKEIGTRLYVSPRTVEHHLRQVFTKLGITSRHQLEDHF
ncbi:LuxR family transcriptional regulator [Actinomadura sp. NAK00032]|uniref:helix-turn-helix transcriptional regulator n=1 Tax=Actinomadura sp. NAK00032 TaxID=2742128 RepID=UPI001C3768DA|nr:LuxR family transcriptional regulator [Actinomadura sp. NAK00032]